VKQRIHISLHALENSMHFSINKHALTKMIHKYRS